MNPTPYIQNFTGKKELKSKSRPVFAVKCSVVRKVKKYSLWNFFPNYEIEHNTENTQIGHRRFYTQHDHF